jgi:hypothetical protein
MTSIKGTRPKLVAAAAMVAMLGLSACGDTMGQRAVSGGVIGGAGGALAGPAFGFNPMTGLILGGLGGAAIGAATAPQRPYYSNGYGY